MNVASEDYNPLSLLQGIPNEIAREICTFLPGWARSCLRLASTEWCSVIPIEDCNSNANIFAKTGNNNISDLTDLKGIAQVVVKKIDIINPYILYNAKSSNRLSLGGGIDCNLNLNIDQQFDSMYYWAPDDSLHCCFCNKNLYNTTYTTIPGNVIGNRTKYAITPSQENFPCDQACKVNFVNKVVITISEMIIAAYCERADINNPGIPFENVNTNSITEFFNSFDSAVFYKYPDFWDVHKIWKPTWMNTKN